MEIPIFLALLVAAVWGAFSLYFKHSSVTIVHDYEKGLRYRDGKLESVVGAGYYRLFGKRTRITLHDVRLLPLVIGAQEVSTKDHVSVRISLVGHFQISDIKKAIHETSSYTQDMHVAVQLALRDVVADMTVDDVLASRGAIDAEVLKRIQPQLAECGLSVPHLAVRDVILPANLKKAMAGVVEAQKETQRNLEKARGEQAVLRSLANSARMLADNPHLLNVRLIQALEQGRNTIVFGADGMKVEEKKD